MSLTPQLGVNGEVRRLFERTLYCDASHHQGAAGWAVVENEECVFQDWARGITSNLAEGMAVLEAYIHVRDSPSATIYTDSLSWASAVDRRRSIRGKESRNIFDQIMDIDRPGIRLRWIPGHTGLIKGNELADHYAKMARICRTSSIARP